MTWHAIVPLKRPTGRKSRLAPVLAPRQRAALVAEMLGRAEAALRTSGRIDRRALLAALPEPGWRGDWIDDRGLPLNAALDSARAGLAGSGVLVLLADLPLVAAEDVRAIIARADRLGVALAPDRHGRGTNAIAVRADMRWRFLFGADSFARHLRQAEENCVVARPGLAIDCDDEADLRHVAALRSRAALVSGSGRDLLAQDELLDLAGGI
jgi:2-phospho-L-lactate guanylyltransferase